MMYGMIRGLTRLPRLGCYGHTPLWYRCPNKPERLPERVCSYHQSVKRSEWKAKQRSEANYIASRVYLPRPPPRTLQERKQKRQDLQSLRDGRDTYTTLERQLYENIVAGSTIAVDHLRDRITSRTVSMKDVHVCLSAEHEKLLASAPKDRPISSPPGLAHLALEYLWTMDPALLVKLINDDRFRAALCRFAILEGLESLLIQWLQVEPQIPPKDGAGRTDMYWRNDLYRSIVDAHLFIGLQDGSADAAIRSYFEILELRLSAAKQIDQHASSETGFHSVSDWAALCGLAIELGRGHYRNTDPGLYEKLRRRYSDWSNLRYAADADFQAMVRRYNCACLWLWHPRSPEYRDFIDLLRDFESGVGTRKSFLDPNLRLKRIGQQAIQLARRAGQQQDVRYIEETMEKVLRTSPPVSKVRPPQK